MWRENQAGDRENDNFVIEVRSIVLSITRGRLEQNMERKKKKNDVHYSLIGALARKSMLHACSLRRANLGGWGF